MTHTDESAALLEAAQKLADGLAQSQLYSNYLQTKAELEKDTALCRRVAEYKKICAAYEEKLQAGCSNFEQEKHISHLFAGLTLNPVTGQFLEAESAILKVCCGILEIISNGVEM